MKKPKSTRGKAAAKAAPSATPAKASKTGSVIQKTLPFEEEKSEPHIEGAKVAAPLSSPSNFEDIPEDALPPARPEPVLSLKLSAALHGRLRHQAQDEGISIEALVQEMLAESVVLRAWEIMERKTAMRGGSAGMGSGQPHGQGGGHRSNYGQGQPANGNSKYSRPHYNAPTGQGGYGNGGRSNGYQNNQGRNQNQAWMEDRAAFLEYVRNQEKRGRR